MNPAARRAVAALLVVPVLSLALPAPARAGEAFAVPAAAQRALVQRLLVEQGVDGRAAALRAMALTDEEAARLAADFDDLPAGAGQNPLEVIAVAVVLYVGLYAVAAAALLIVCGLVVVAIAKALDRRGRHASDIMRRP